MLTLGKGVRVSAKLLMMGRGGGVGTKGVNITIIKQMIIEVIDFFGR